MAAASTWPDKVSRAHPRLRHVNEEHLHKAKAREAELLKEFANPLRIVQAA